MFERAARLHESDLVIENISDFIKKVSIFFIIYTIFSDSPLLPVLQQRFCYFVYSYPVSSSPPLPSDSKIVHDRSLFNLSFTCVNSLEVNPQQSSILHVSLVSVLECPRMFRNYNYSADFFPSIDPSVILPNRSLCPISSALQISKVFKKLFCSMQNTFSFVVRPSIRFILRTHRRRIPRFECKRFLFFSQPHSPQLNSLEHCALIKGL